MVREEKLKRLLLDMEAWELAHVRSKPKDGKGKYYGKSGEHLETYKELYLGYNADTPDPIKEATDDRVVVGIGPKSHGRHPVLDAVVTPSISYTQLRLTNPSLSSGSSTPRAHSESLLAQQHSVRIFPLIFLFSHFIFHIEMFL